MTKPRAQRRRCSGMDTPFVISPLALGKGTVAMCRMPGAVTDLEADVAALVQTDATCVVSLTPLDELADAGSGLLPASLAAQGIAWRHFPIGDFGTPQPAQQGDWRTLSHDLHARLDQGENVVIHCRAGLGRTGMVVLRLMVERGEDPATALHRLRQARPGTVERPAQFDWAAQGTARVADGQS